MPNEPAWEATVTRHEGTRFWVDRPEGSELPCSLRGKLRREGARVTQPVVIGDRVSARDLGGGSGVIEAVLPRRSELSRPGHRGLVHVVAANLDQLIIVQSAREPHFQRHLVERFLATAQRGRMQAVVVVNKLDLAEPSELAAELAPLRASQVPVVLASTVTGHGLDELRTLLQGRLSALMGKSGVGKSTLVNALFPGFEVRTGAVSDALHKGRHTTTSSRLYPIPGGGYIADTPGIRELGLFDDDQALAAAFPEISAAASRCRFRDCRHTQEAGCAVRTAVERGGIDADRLKHFRRLSRGE